jgi:hypothetical protein
VKREPPRFLQNMRERIGIALNAMRGPDEPIPSIPIPNLIKSGRPGIAVMSEEVGAMDET